ncbi:hypothetical protein [uncultured Selenomonas sp.]|uniref:hypothetical protein n=1 Tax=uncultured Selenomonas sp. TaxID=159275 RepID=UPI0025D86741|nr:hypothetical protein [uncultured Selenomonas sp.]
MAKIPKNLSDKDMMKNWVEPETLEEQFEKAEKAAEKKRREAPGVEPPMELAKAGFNRRLTEELGKALTELKLQLQLKGATDITFKIKKDGETIKITPHYNM